jgi:predicted RNase H-like HicB family nuclease
MRIIERAEEEAELAKEHKAVSHGPMREIIFEVREDETDGGYNAAALGHDIFTEGDTLAELRANVREAVQCHLGDGVPGPLPQVIRLHFVRDEVLAT